MLCLPDDCLFIIFDYLCFKDQQSCAKSHERFDFLLREIVWKKKLRPWRAYAELDSATYDEIFSINTEQMKGLTIGEVNLYGSCDWFHKRIEFCSKFQYPKLQYMNLYAIDLLQSLDDFQLTTSQCPCLTTLHIVSLQAVLHFGKPSARKIPSPLERGMLCYSYCNAAALMKKVLCLQQNLDLKLKILKLSMHSVDNEFIKLLEESALKSLKVIVVCLHESYCDSLDLFGNIADRVIELGIFNARLMWNGAALVFPNVLRLHLSGITSNFWLLLASCPNVQSISVFYKDGPERLQIEHLVALEEILYGGSWTLERQPDERVIAMRFHTSMSACLDELIKEKASRSVIRQQRHYRFEYFFEASIDERMFRLPPCLHFYL